jgi:fibronectin-binding autotransporter adhesin
MRFASALNLGSGSIGLGAASTSGIYRYDGATASRVGLFTLNGSGEIAVTDPAAVFTIPTGLTGAGSLVKTGSGTLQLSGSGNFTGGTTISSGTVLAGVARALGTGNVVVGNGGVLAVATPLDLGTGFSVTTQPGGLVSVASGGSLPLAAGSSLAGFRSASANTTASILSGSVGPSGGTVSATWLPTATGLFSDVLELSTATAWRGDDNVRAGAQLGLLHLEREAAQHDRESHVGEPGELPSHLFTLHCEFTDWA